MLTSLQIRNFKAWKDTGHIRLAPLTVIFGANSAGKSSLGHLLLALKQTILSADRKRPLHLGDDNALIDLGTFAECLHNHDMGNDLEFELGWKIPGKELEARDPLSKTIFSGDELKLSVTLRADSNQQPKVEKLSYHLLKNNKNEIAVSYGKDEKGKLDIVSKEYKFVRNTGRIWPLDDPDKFYRISDQSRARFQNAEFLSDFALNTEAALNSLHYLGPLRDHPKRIYSWSGETPESVGQKGEFAVAAILAASAQGRKLNRGPKRALLRFDEFIAQWLKDLGDVFLKWLLQNLANTSRVEQVTITELTADSFVEFPDAALEPNFDAPDRKFAAVANKHLNKPAILQAADCKWLDWWPALKAKGIRVEFLCPSDICQFYSNKFPEKPVPSLPD